MNGNSQYLTIDDVAKTLNLTRQTISKYIHNKKLNAIKISKSYRIPVEEFNEFMNKNKTISDSLIEIPYKTKSKNCSLFYNEKAFEFEILNMDCNGRLEETEKQHCEKYNAFLSGDNLNILNLMREKLTNKIDLIYIDPPFGTGQIFSNYNKETAYSDSLIKQEYLEFLRKRLILLRELLTEFGSIYLHIDKQIGHYVKIIMDEIFGDKNFINDITRIKCNPKNFSRKAYGNYSDMILFYAKKRDNQIWNEIKDPLSEIDINNLFPKLDNMGQRFTTHPLHAPGETINGDTGQEWNGLKPPKGRHWRYTREVLSKLNEEGLIEWSKTGNPRKIVFAKNHNGRKIQDIWEYKDKGISYSSYPTEKNYEMLKRIILNSSNENSLVLDCFAGSGNTLIAANDLNRKWIGIDNSLKSLEVVKKNFESNGIDCNYYNYLTVV